MLYGVETAFESPKVVPPTPGNSWAIAPVVFNAAYLVASPLFGSDSKIFSFAGWFKTAWDSSQYAWVVDPNGLFGTWLAGFYTPGSGSLTPNIADTTSFAQALIGPYHTSWQHIIGTFVTDPVNDPIMIIYVDDVSESALAASQLTGKGPMGLIRSHGLPFFIGSDSQGNDYVGEMADVSIWPGVDFRTGGDIVTATRRLFIDSSGNPVNPTQAILTFGSPSILLTGNAANFHLNTFGRSGALTLTAGSLSDGVYAPGTKTPGFKSYGAYTTNTMSPPLPHFYSTGDLLLAVITVTSSGTTAFSVASPWTLGASWNNGSTRAYAWAWKIATGTDSAPVFTTTLGDTAGQAQTYSFDGVNASPIGASGHNFGTSTSFSVSAITTGAAYSMVFGFVKNNQATQTFATKPANYATAIPPTGAVFNPFYQIIPAAGLSSAFSGTFNVNAFWGAALIEIKR